MPNDEFVSGCRYLMKLRPADYQRDTQDRDELIAALKAAKPGMITRSL